MLIWDLSDISVPYFSRGKCIEDPVFLIIIGSKREQGLFWFVFSKKDEKQKPPVSAWRPTQAGSSATHTRPVPTVRNSCSQSSIETDEGPNHIPAYVRGLIICYRLIVVSPHTST